MLRRRIVFSWAVAAAMVVGAVGASSAVAGSLPYPALHAGTPPPGQQQLPNAGYTTSGAWNFKSAPNLHPPKLYFDSAVRRNKLTPGMLLTGAFKNLTITKPMVGEGGPLVLNNDLQPVWFQPDCINSCSTADIWTQNLQQQTYERQPVLTWWEGALSPTGVTQSGEEFVVNEHYATVATLKGADGWIVDSHDFVVSGHDAWVTMTKNVPTDLSAYGGSKNGSVVDTAIQEYDLRNGQLLYTWDPLAHIPLSDSYTRPAPNGTPWDAYHLNSLQLGNGTILAGFRNTWAAYQIVIATGQVKWVLGGNGKDPYTHFTFGPGASFAWQHNVELHRHGIVTLFNDDCCAITGAKNGVAQFAPPEGPAQAMVLKLDYSNHTASLRAKYLRASNFYVAFTGSTQLLPIGKQPYSNVLVGWGSQPYFSEYSKAGSRLFDAAWPYDDLSYRVELTPDWVGTPFYPPSGTVVKHNGHSTVYASWDGATEVVSWEVLAGSKKHLKPVATAPKTGFETAIYLSHTYPFYVVRALGAHGRVLRTGPYFPTPTRSGFNPGFY
jgi:hypothetical protein